MDYFLSYHANTHIHKHTHTDTNVLYILRFIVTMVICILFVSELFPSHSAFCRPQASTDLLQDNYLRMSLMSQAASWSPYLGSSGQGHLSDPWNYFLSNSGSFRSTQNRNSKLVCPTVYKPKAISLKSLQKVYNEVKRY